MPEVLVVCTANICRSPMAAALLRSWVDHHAPHVADELRITSAGVHARDGHAATPHMVAIADRWGLDLDGHRSRHLDVDRAVGADLVITMEAAHRDAVARLASGLGSRTFTLRELAELTEQVDPDDHHDLDGWVRSLHAARPRVWVEITDVEDPYGGPAAGYEPTAAELTELVERIAPALTAVVTTR